MTRIRWWVALGAVLAVVGPPATAQAAGGGGAADPATAATAAASAVAGTDGSATTESSATTTTVTGAVTAKLLAGAARSADARPARSADARVTVSRTGRGWAFGTAVLVAPHERDAHPTGSVFLARADGAGWQVAFDGEAAFADLAADSPVVSAAERRVFAAPPVGTLANGDQRTGMALPFAVGQTWGMAGGPHGWGGSAAPWSSIDLAGGDQVVRAARSGAAYTMCQGWIRVIHDRGYSTDYYHLWSNISASGLSVAQGTFLGYTGTDVTCGGSASGRHVHFGLRQNSVYVPIADHDVGKWVFVNGGASYQGGARHGSAFVGAGGALYNHGALGFTQAVVDANGGGSVNRRTGPGTGYAVAGSLGDGATVGVACSGNGTTHTGRYGSTALWNRLTDGTWVTDAYLWTGINGPINGWC